MANGIYSPLSGMRVLERQLDVSANNLANVSTPGFKADRLSFEQMLAETRIHPTGLPIPEELSDPQRVDKLMTTSANGWTQFAQGAIKSTGNPLDLALQGQGFFVVDLGNGLTGLTRNGSFQLDQNGMLATHEGKPVMGENSNILLDPAGGVVEVTTEGMVLQGGKEVGQIAVRSVPNLAQLVKLGHNYWQAQPGQTLKPMPETQVVQGGLEESNISAVKEMIAMIRVQRHFEALQKIVESQAEMDRNAVNRVARSNQ